MLLFTSGLDNLTNDLPLHPVFVAFIDKAARYLSGHERLERLLNWLIRSCNFAPLPIQPVRSRT